MAARISQSISQPPIHDYAIVGDGRSVALISRAGSVDWLCWPHFDSPPIFARLLDDEGGSWSITPAVPARAKRRYLGDTNVVETAFENADGRCTLIDLMSVASEEDKALALFPDHELVRVVRCERGEAELEVRVEPRPDFGRSRVRVTAHRALGIRWQIGSRLLTLRAEVPLQLDERGVARGLIRLHAGESCTLSMSFDEDGPAVLPSLGDLARERVDRTCQWWSAWAARARYEGAYRDQVIRSLLAVKLMAFAPSGAIVAAPTTSLPERMGGARNWDYRFCWLRDAAFTARAFLQLGYVEDAEAFCSWLLHSTRLTRPELHVLYDVYGRSPPRERGVEAVTGYRGSLPVRIGNAAAAQLQLDCYGEVIDATSQVAHAVGGLDHDTQALLRDFGDYVAHHWRLADQGIWEPREPPRHRTHSRLLCWVALERLAELAAAGLVSGVDRQRVMHECTAIRADIEAHAFDPELASYTGTLGGHDLDASVLLMSWYGFHSAGAPRMRSTYRRIAGALSAGNGLLYRYEASRSRGEGAFWICSFWAVEHLARGGGTLAEAQMMMDAACSYANDVGLMAEEVDTVSHEGLGNFPQAYTHVGLIGAAVSLEQQRTRSVERPHDPHHARLELRW